jgi:5-methylcytosine-specific restriction endonuclease McrA
MAWIFQGNPKKFDVDDYLARYPQLIYWRVPRYQSEVAVGDRAFIWRAGFDSGVVASGVVVEAPVIASRALHPEALGDDLWFAEKPDGDEPKVGISLDSIRLFRTEGMLSRTVVKDDPLLQQSTIIRMANGTVFRLEDNERRRIEELWVAARESEPEQSEPSATEGQQQFRAHRRRERSRFLVQKKLEQFRGDHGALHCEVCALSEVGQYPATLAARIFEVHHTLPLSSAATPRRTTLEDLAVLCANCHRAVHATADVEFNMQAIKRLFTK